MKKYLIGSGMLIVLGVLAAVLLGDGGLKRHVTLSGLYCVVKPDGWNMVCCLDSDSPDGGLSCLPMSQVAK